MTQDADAGVAFAIAAALTSSLVLEEVLPVVAQRIAEALDVWECDLYEYDAARNALISTATWARETTPADEDWVGTVVDLKGRDSYRTVIEERVVVECRRDDPDTAPEDERLLAEWGEECALTAPLVFEDTVIGCLTLIEKRLRRFSDDERALLARLAIPASIGIHNALTYRRQQQQSRQLASLLDSARAITSTFVLEDVLATVARKAAEALGTPQCIIYEYEPERDALVFRSIHPQSAHETMQEKIGTAYRLADFPADRAILDGGRIVQETLSDEDLDPTVRADMERLGEQTILEVPLMFKGEALGTLLLIEDQRERRFSEREVELITALGDQAAAAITNARHYRRQQEENERLLALLEASRLIGSSLQLDEVLRLVKAEVVRAFGGSDDEVAIMLRDEDGRYIPGEEWRAVARQRHAARSGAAHAGAERERVGVRLARRALCRARRALRFPQDRQRAVARVRES